MIDKQRVLKVFESLKPIFLEHEGDFEVRDITDDGVIKVKLVGSCELCTLKEKTTRGIEGMLKKEIPGIKRVEPVD